MSDPVTQFGLEFPEDEECTTSPGHLFRCPAVLMMKSFPLCPVWTFHVSTAHCLSSSCHAPLLRAWLYLPDHLKVGIGKLLASPEAISSPGCTSTVSTASSRGVCTQAPNYLSRASAELTLVYQCLSCTGGPQTWSSILDEVQWMLNRGRSLLAWVS